MVGRQSLRGQAKERSPELMQSDTGYRCLLKGGGNARKRCISSYRLMYKGS